MRLREMQDERGLCMKIFPKPSRFCGMCAIKKENCYCECHKYAMFSGYHEELTKGIPLEKKHGRIVTFINKLFHRKTEYI